MAKKAPQPDRYALVGHPVEHSRSPLIHQLFAKQTRQDLTYELIDAEPRSLETAIRGFFAAGGFGMNVTVPHKEAAFELTDKPSDSAKKARAVNTLSFKNGVLYGDNTDGLGFIRDVTINQRQAIDGRSVLVLGAGGAARGILAPILEAGPSEVVVANRTVERAEQLVEQFREWNSLSTTTFAALAERAPFDILVNATAAGLKGEAPPFPATIVGPESFCYDLVYSLKETPFVTWVRRHGARRAVQGWGMLIEQAAESFYIWRRKRPDTAPILRQLVR